MKLSRIVSHGVMTMIDIATHQNDGYIDVPSLAKLQNVYPSVVSITLRLLRDAKLVEAYRGRGGGYRVSRPLSDISLAEVYEAVGGRFELSPCLEDRSDCPGCQLRTVWEDVSDVIWLKLHDVKLDDLGYDCLYTNKLDNFADLAR